MDKQLRIIAGGIVGESKLSKQAKIQMINFIKSEATDAQIKALLMDGNIVQLDEQAEEIVNARFELHPLNEGVFKSLFGMFMLTPAGWIIYRLIRATFSKASRKCGALSIGKIRDLCLLRAKLTKYQKLIRLINSQMKNCSKAKNPEKCTAKGKEKIAGWNEDIKEVMARIKDVQASGPQFKVKVDKKEG